MPHDRSPIDRPPPAPRVATPRVATPHVDAAAAAALGRLEPLLREVVVLRDVLGLSYRDVARVTGASVDVVRARLASGRQAWAAARAEARRR